MPATLRLTTWQCWIIKHKPQIDPWLLDSSWVQIRSLWQPHSRAGASETLTWMISAHWLPFKQIRQMIYPFLLSWTAFSGISPGYCECYRFLTLLQYLVEVLLILPVIRSRWPSKPKRQSDAWERLLLPSTKFSAISLTNVFKCIPYLITLV